MQQALTSPITRAIAVACLLLALTLSVRSRAATTTQHEARLVLHTVWRPGVIYLSWWRDGDVAVALERGPLQPMTFAASAWIDGCKWNATETLEPIDARHYAYSYQETLVRCRPGGVPWHKTPRTGIVTVVE